jgi:hypothetical protein
MASAIQTGGLLNKCNCDAQSETLRDADQYHCTAQAHHRFHVSFCSKSTCTQSFRRSLFLLIVERHQIPCRGPIHHASDDENMVTSKHQGPQRLHNSFIIAPHHSFHPVIDKTLCVPRVSFNKHTTLPSSLQNFIFKH